MNPEHAKGTPPKRPFHRRRWFIASLALVLLLGVLLALLPLGIGYGLKSWLLQNGADRAEIENVDFNPFTGSFALHDLEVAAGDQAPLRLSALEGIVRWAPLWKRRAHIETLTLKGIRLSIERADSGALKFGGLALPQSTRDDPGGTTAPAWGFARRTCIGRARPPMACPTDRPSWRRRVTSGWGSCSWTRRSTSRSCLRSTA